MIESPMPATDIDAPSSGCTAEGCGDITSQHTADITPRTIIPAGLADKLDLGQTIWASFANTRTAEERRQTHEQELAA
jgi:hypothetical protein